MQTHAAAMMGGDVLDRNHQHDELESILQMEQQEYGTARGMMGGMPEGAQWTGFAGMTGGGDGVLVGGEERVVFKTEPHWG